VGLKLCDPGDFDTECIEIPGSYCHPELKLCMCLMADGTIPEGSEGDRVMCDGACVPGNKCPPEAGPEAGQDGSPEASVPEPECSTEADCEGPPDARCGKAVCNEGVCGLELLALPGELVPIESQRRGDCHHVYCDATGSVVEVTDGGDVFNDGKACTIDVCEDGNPMSILYPDGSPCPEGGSGYCYGGECVECIDWINGANDCGNGQGCDGLYCVPSACVVNQDCGSTCAPCLAGFACSANEDCKDGVCNANGMCELPSCSDKVKNDGETGKDCGAPSCAAQCPTGDGCNLHSDCMSGVCWVGLCQAPACNDGVQNGNETGIDCGGACPICPPAL
jgi:hypothetical protein